MLNIVLVDNGNLLLKNITLKSLYTQTSKYFNLIIHNAKSSQPFYESFYKTYIAKGTSADNWYFFIEAGSKLDKIAVECFNSAIESTHSDWYYGDECRNIISLWAKPKFDPFCFATSLFRGKCVLFSDSILQKIDYTADSSRFELNLMQLTIKAASLCDGMHIEAPLLHYPDSPLFTPEEYILVNKYLSDYLFARNLPFYAVWNKNSGIGHLYSTHSAQTPPYSVIVIGNSEPQDYLEHLYNNSGNEVIVECGNKSWGEKCNNAIKKATHDLLFILSAGTMMPNPINLCTLSHYALINDVGTVSPQIYDTVGNLIYAGTPLILNGFCKTSCYHESNNTDYLKTVRGISVPSQHLLVTRKHFWNLVDGFSNKAISADFCVNDFALKLEQIGLVNLYSGDSYAYMFPQKQQMLQYGLISMLNKWKSRFTTDPYFTNSMSRQIMAEPNRECFSPKEWCQKKENAKNILLLTHELSMTGAPIVLLSAMNILNEAGYNLVVLSPKDGILRNSIVDAQVPLIIDKSIYTDDSWLSYAKEFDLIIVNTVVPYKCIDSLKNLPIPVIWWVHDARFGYSSFLKHVLPESIGDNIMIYGGGNYAKDVLLEFRPQYTADVLLYGLPDSFQENSSFKFYNPENRNIIITVGSIESRKGQDIFLEAIELLDDNIKDNCLFIFIGKPCDDSIFNKIETAIKEHPQQFQWIPQLSREDLFAAYEQATAVVCASRDDPLPAFMTETLMHSGICICSENTGTASLLKNGENGFVYHNNSPKELSRMITYVVQQKDQLDTIRSNARKTYEKHFSMSVFKNNLLNIVADII